MQISWRAAIQLLVGTSTTVATLVLPSTPPRGFNSFDSYGGLNHSKTMELASALKSQLLPAGYDTLVLDGGWSMSGAHNQDEHLDQYGRPVPDPARFPQGMKALAAEVHSLGLKFGLWNIRGVHVSAVTQALKIKGTNYTFSSPGFVDEQPVGGGKNGSCLWASDWLGVNGSHPAAQSYYDSRIELFAEWDVDFLKADCMMCGPCYTDEMNMYTAAVKQSPRSFVLSYSPGGGNEPSDGKWVAQNQIGTMYRIVTDFHGGWYGWGGLQQAIFIAGNFTAAKLNGLNGTFPDNDMLPLGPSWWGPTSLKAGWMPEQADRGQTIITLDMISRSPLMHAGVLPTDPVTLAYETNPLALQVNSAGANTRVVRYQGNCTCSGGPGGSCTIPHTENKEAATLTTTAADEACIAVWAADVNGGVAAIGTGGWTAVALFNLGESNGTVAVQPDDLAAAGAVTGIAGAGVGYTVIDIWTGKAGPAIGSHAVIRPHAALFFKVALQTSSATAGQAVAEIRRERPMRVSSSEM